MVFPDQCLSIRVCYFVGRAFILSQKYGNYIDFETYREQTQVVAAELQLNYLQMNDDVTDLFI